MAIVVKSVKVAESIEMLRNMKVHPHLVGYLCIQRAAFNAGSQIDLSPNFKQFYDEFLRLPDALPGYPYLRLFVEEKASSKNLFLNKNVAGSYAPSSIRDRLRKVITTTGSGSKSRYSLKPKHWALAQEHLCKGQKIPVVQLSVVLYRDYSIQSSKLSLIDLIDAFKDEFGYLNPFSGEEHAFEHLYHDESSTLEPAEWLEEFSDGDIN